MFEVDQERFKAVRDNHFPPLGTELWYLKGESLWVTNRKNSVKSSFHHDSLSHNKDRNLHGGNYAKGLSNNSGGWFSGLFSIPSNGYDPSKMSHGPGKRKK